MKIKIAWQALIWRGLINRIRMCSKLQNYAVYFGPDMKISSRWILVTKMISQVSQTARSKYI